MHIFQRNMGTKAKILKPIQKKNHKKTFLILGEQEIKSIYCNVGFLIE